MERSGRRCALLRGEGLPDASHVKASFTAAIVVRSLWAALGEVCVVGWVADRLVVCGLVSVDVVVAVDIRVRGISLKMVGWKTRLRRLVAARAGKSHWLAAVLKAYDGRSVTRATVEPSVGASRNQGQKIPDGRWLAGLRASTGPLDGAARGTHR
jgi:hypothetical protein